MAFLKVHYSSLFITVLLLFSFILALNYQLIERVDFLLFDWQSKQIAKQLGSDDDIVVIAIDDYSLQKMSTVAGRWVWPRTVHAQLLASFKQRSVLAVVFDVLFSEKDIYRPDADLYFNEVLSESSNVFFATLQQNIVHGSGTLVSKFPQALGLQKNPSANKNARASFILPSAINESNWQTGTINFTPEIDGVGRYYDVYRNIEGWEIPSLPAKTVGDLGIALPDVKRVLLQWRGGSEQPFKTLSYVDVYQAVQENNNDFLRQLNNKVIVIGATASGLYDARSTPVNNALAGVYMLAMAIDNLKNKRFLMVKNNTVTFIVGCLLLLVIASCFVFIKRYNVQVITSAIALLFATGILFTSNYYLLLQQHVTFIGTPLFFMGLSFLIFSMRFGYIEYRQRQEALLLFARFLDPKVVNELFKQGALEPEKLNKKQMVSILFSDIRGFTNISEKNDAQEVVRLLNQYFNLQVSVIFKNKGTLDKFIGDCVMAFWGAPITNENHAIDAINSALIMEQQLFDFRQTLPESLKHFDIGIGIHSGEALVGMVGSDLRLDYTVMGDAVNLASRIEGLTKNSSRILVSEQTKALSIKTFDFEFKGEFSVKGRESKVNLYQPKRKKA
ncbi:MAG: adenylate/guanylate cyclase domain-containing protein [Colwellia sp.]